MKQYFDKNFQRAKLHFDNLRSKVVTRVWNLAKRLDKFGKNRDKKK